MRRWVILILICAPVLAVACNRRQGESQTGPAVFTGDRDEYTGSAERRLSALGARIDSLKAEVDSSTAVTKQEVAQELEPIESERQQAAVKIQGLRMSAGERWNALKLELADLLDDLDRSFDRARARLRDRHG